MPTLSDYLLRPVAGVATVNVGTWVQLVNNLTAAAFVSTAATDATGKFTVNNVPAGPYTVNTGPTSGGPWTSTGDTSYIVADQPGVFNATDYGSTKTDVAINAALAAAAAAGGGIVDLAPGTWTLGASLVINSDYITIRGQGWNTVIRAANSLNADLIKTPTTATSVRNYCSIRDLKIDGNRAGNSSGACVHLYGSRYCEVVRCNIVNATNWAINLDGDGVGFGFNNTIQGNVLDTGNGCVTESNSEANYFANNQFKYSDTNEMVVLTTGFNMLLGNVFGSGGNYPGPALDLSNGAPSKIIGNRFDTTRHQSIKSGSGADIIIGNSIFRPCSATSNTEDAIQLGGLGGQRIVLGNRVYSDITATWRYALGMDGGGDNNLAAMNQFMAGLTGVINPAGVHTVVRSNPGFNPQGPAAITVTASPFTYTNQDSVDEMVHIDGGTVTTVVKNAVTLHSFGGTAARCVVFLAPNEAVTVTYTVAPTMNKDRR